MLMVILLNSCFWAGMGMLMARFFHDVLAHLLATFVVGFATIVISLEVLSLPAQFSLFQWLGSAGSC